MTDTKSTDIGIHHSSDVPAVYDADVLHVTVKGKPSYFECGGCGAYHPFGWNGDCRVDSMRFYADQLDNLYGLFGWKEVEEREIQ